MVHFIRSVWQDDKIVALMLLPFFLLTVVGTAAVLAIPALYIANGFHPVVIP